MSSVPSALTFPEMLPSISENTPFSRLLSQVMSCLSSSASASILLFAGYHPAFSFRLRLASSSLLRLRSKRLNSLFHRLLANTLPRLVPASEVESTRKSAVMPLPSLLLLTVISPVTAPSIPSEPLLMKGLAMPRSKRSRAMLSVSVASLARPPFMRMSWSPEVSSTPSKDILLPSITMPAGITFHSAELK